MRPHSSLGDTPPSPPTQPSPTQTGTACHIAVARLIGTQVRQSEQKVRSEVQRMSDAMQAAFFAGNGAVELREVPVPQPGSGEVALDTQPTVTPVRTRSRQITQPHPQLLMPGRHVPIPLRGAGKCQHATCPTFADFVAGLQARHRVPAAHRRQGFFRSTSCSVALSSVRSATSCFSRRFSSSNCFSRRISLTPNPP